MPRFDEKGFNPSKRLENETRDRTVPDDFEENLYNNIDVDDLRPPQRDYRQIKQEFDMDMFSVERGEQKPQKNSYKPEKSAPKKSKKPNKGIDKKKKAKLRLAGVLAVLLVIVIGVGGLFNSVLGDITYDKKRSNQYVSSSDLMHSSQVKNILLLGVDARNPDDDTKSRSDSMMVVSIDKKNNCVKMVSFLRDTWVYIPAKDGKQRLNAACSTDGYNGVMDTIEYNFGIDIQGYVVADFEMFKVLVDSVGGVEVDVTEKEAKEVTSHKKRYGNVKLESGKYKLTGEQALAYCRIRKIDTDFQRAYRQRTVMQSILKGVKSTNPLKLVSMVKGCAPYIETNLSKTEIMSLGLAALPTLKSDMCETRVPFDGTWQYSNIGGASVITIDADKNKEMLIDYLYNKTPDQIKAEEKK